MSFSTALPVGLYEKALPAGWSWDERLSAAVRAGYDFVEISIDESDARLARLDWSPQERAGLRSAIAGSGIPLLTMCLSAHRRYPVGSHSAEVRRRGADIFEKAIDLAGDLGIRIIQVGGYDVFYEPHDDGTASRFVDGLCRAARLAGRGGVMLALENVDVPLTASMAASLDVVAAVDSPWFQAYADMANLAAMGFDSPQQLALAGNHLVAVHVKDGLPGVVRGVPFGQGIVPFAEVFAALRDLHFCGPLTVEMWADLDQTGEPLATAAAARDFVRRQITAAGLSTPATD